MSQLTPSSNIVGLYIAINNETPGYTQYTSEMNNNNYTSGINYAQQLLTQNTISYNAAAPGTVASTTLSSVFSNLGLATTGASGTAAGAQAGLYNAMVAILNSPTSAVVTAYGNNSLAYAINWLVSALATMSSSDSNYANYSTAKANLNNSISNGITYSSNSANVSAGTPSTTTPSTTYTLTTGVDSLSGGSNATFIADNSTASNNVTSAADTITGSGTGNTLKVFMKAADATALSLPTMTGVQTLYINGGALTGATALDVSNVSGLTALTIDGSTGAAPTYTLAGQSVTLENMAGAAAQTFTLASSSDTTENVTVSKIGTTNAATVDVKGSKVTSASLTSSGTASGTANAITLTNTGVAVKTVTIGGSSDLTATIGAGAAAGFDANGITSIDASSSSGAVSLTISSSAVAGDSNLATTFAFKAGSGGDTLDLTSADVAGAALSATSLNKMTITGGSGTDQVNLANSIVSGTTKITSLSSIEVIGDSAATGTIDMSNFSAANELKFTGNLAGNVTINNLASGDTLVLGDTTTIVGANNVTVAASGTGTSDTLNLTAGVSASFGATGDASATTITGYETVNLTAGGDGTTTDYFGSGGLVITASAGGNETLNITANNPVNFKGVVTLSGASTSLNTSGAGAQTYTGVVTAGHWTDTGTGGVTASAANAILNADFSGETGAVTFNDSGAASAALIKAGSGTTTITTSTHADVLTLGSGTTNVTEAANNTSVLTITLASGHTKTDTLTMSITHSNTAGDSVTNFVLNQDVLKNTAHALAAGTELSATSGVIASTAYTSSSAFITAAEASLSPTAAGDTVIWYDSTNNNTWVAEYTTATATTANQAHIVELVGVHATAISTTAAASTITIA